MRLIYESFRFERAESQNEAFVQFTPPEGGIIGCVPTESGVVVDSTDDIRLYQTDVGFTRQFRLSGLRG
jgi:hypothetical protein